jgi:hypothetical protein
MSFAAEDRNRNAGLPSGLSDASYSRIRTQLEERRARQARWAGVVSGQPAPVPPQQQPQPQSRQTRIASSEDTKRFARVADVEAAGFKRIASCMYKQGHDIWELRRADDENGGYCLVRKREERAVDLRNAGSRAAIESGVVRTAARGNAQMVGSPPAPLMGCPSCGSHIRFSIGLQRSGPAYCERSAQVTHRGSLGVGRYACPFVGRVARRAGGGLDLYDVRGQRLGQLAPDMPLPPANLGQGGGAEMPGADPLPVAEDDFDRNQAEEWFDAHEVAHGREPVYDPNAPLVTSLQEVVDDQENGDDGDDGNGSDGDEPAADDGGDSDDSDDGNGGGPALPFGGKEGKAPPGEKWERLVKELKDDPNVDDPYAVAWAQYNESTGKKKKKEGCGSALHSRRGHRCLRGKKVLAVRKGGVAEGVVLKVLPLGDLLTQFDGGDPDGENVPLEMILSDLLGGDAGCPMCGHDGCPESCPDGCDCKTGMELSPTKHELVEDKEAARAALLITADDLA